MSEIDVAPEPPRSVGELIDRLEDRSVAQRQWLLENGPQCFEEQKHTDSGSPERLYWHYGYMVALRDVVGALRRIKQATGDD